MAYGRSVSYQLEFITVIYPDGGLSQPLPGVPVNDNAKPQPKSCGWADRVEGDMVAGGLW